MILRVLFLMLIAAGFGVGGLVLFRSPPDEGVAVATPAPRLAAAVLVAARAVPAGTLLRAEDLRWQDWPLDEVPVGFMARETVQDETLHGAVTRRNFAAGEPFVQGQVVPPGDRGFLAAVLTPGNRAVAVAVDAVSAASGLIWPGDRVDLILTQTFDAAEAGPRKAAGETVLRDLRVLAIDQRLGEASESSGKEASEGSAAPDARMPRTVTLEATPKQAEAIAVAAGLGRLALSLRSLAVEPGVDRPEPRVTTTWASDVSPALAHQRPAPRATATATAPPTGVQILRGSQKQ
jgi:pilus assembly protein CpaB